MSKGKVIVTGGAGYIGSHACKALALDGYEPVVFDNLSIGNRWAVRWGDVELGDILDPARLHEVFRAHKPVGVLHFAALALVGESMTLPGLYYRNNTGGALNVIETCRIHEVPAFVFSSTCAVYGTPATVPIVESTPTAPINPYGASKLMVEQILADYERSYGFRFAALRYFNAAGADPDGEIGERRDIESHLVPLVLDAIAGHKPPIKVLGTDYPTSDGTAVRDYIHVADLAAAHVRALNSLMAGEPSFTVNLGTGTGYSVKQVIEAAGRVTGHDVPHELAARRPGDPPELVSDASAATQRLGAELTPLSGLDNIIETAWRWHSGDRYRWIMENRARD